MPLSKEQREELEKLVAPLIKEAVETGVTPVIEAEVKRLTEGAREENRSYIEKVLAGSGRARDVTQQKGAGSIGIARIARCVTLANNDPDKALAIAKRDYDDDLGTLVQGVLDQHSKLMSSGDADEGGVFVPSNLSTDFIDALAAKAAVRGAGPVQVSLDGGNLRVPRITTDATSGWIGEGKKRNASTVKSGSLNFTAKTLQTKVGMTQALLRRGSNAETIARNSMLRSMANEEDKTFLAGTGSEYAPRGILNWAKSTNLFNANATTNFVNVEADLTTIISKLTDNNVDIDSACWFMAWRSRNYLAYKHRSADDNPLYKNELTAATPMLRGFRAHLTNNIPINLGGGSDESRIYFAAMQELWLAEEEGMRIRASREASYTDETGTLISAFDQSLMVIIIERDLDFALAHDVGAAVMEQVKYS